MLFPSRWKWVAPFAILTGAAVIGGCAAKTPPLKEYKVLASFGTGEGTVVRALKVDGSFLWVGTSAGILKVNRLNATLVKTYTKADGLTSNYIFTINVDPKGTPWFGTDAGGLLRLDGERWMAYGTSDGLADPWVYDIDFHPDGSMWIGTWNGVNRYDPRAPEGSRFVTYDVKDGLVNKWVYSLAVDRDGSLWFGTEEGANHFDPTAPKGKGWVTYTHKDGLGAPNELALAHKQTAGEALEASRENSGVELPPNRSYAGHFHDLSVLDEKGKETYNENYIFAILIDPRGNKWFGTWGGGVGRFDGEHWTNYSTRQGLAGNIVYALERDRSGVIWAGTNHGLSRFNGTEWRSHTRADGLIGDDVYAVAPDPDGNVWIAQRGGVVELGTKSVEGNKDARR
ncbi:MAG TPA: two-component regulator propeller domain-containing protein [Nitrospiria bacterium]|nr:two-component regulator propeller domain-containing protein [Nitrospiria bacterium]HUK55646.1 two-component regulator propeller domain-containing protein [Nitrospiria bacterium]